MTADEARNYLYGLSLHHERPYDTANMNPDYAIRLATAIQQARKEGIMATVFSGVREPTDHPSRYDLGGNSSHEYGLAADIGGIGVAGSSTAKRWAQIAQANGLSSPYDPNGVEYNHWQLPRLPLEQTPQLLSALKAAKATGNINNVWAAFNSGASQPIGATPAGTYTTDQVFNAIFGQESSYGRDPRAGGNVLQIQPGTWAVYAKPGENINNRQDNMAVGHRIVEDYMQKFGGDPARVAVAYFSGPDNVAPLAFKSPFKEDRGDGSKRVSAYVNDVLGRLGASPSAGGGATGTGAVGGAAAPVAAAPANPNAAALSTIGSALGQAFANYGNSGNAARASVPPDQPAIRSMALGEDFTPPPSSPVPANLAAGAGSTPIGQQLGALAAAPGDPMLVNPSVVPSITAGAPSMSAMLPAPGTTGGVTSLLGGRPNLVNPYATPQRFS
jgi:hypothetical protein